ncbi:hypothetical protein BGW38_000889, partial [Lunasporangiospora selenospora]
MAETEAFKIDAVLDSLDEKELELTFKAPSHFINSDQAMYELKKAASYPFFGPNKLDLRERYAVRLSLDRHIGVYQYHSFILDPFLEIMVAPLITPIRKLVHDATFGEHKGEPMNEHGELVFYLLYLISRTRGYKTVIKFFPHEVADIEPAFAFLKALNKRGTAWETRYVLMLWLSLMCMIPFDLKSIDSNASKTSDRIPLVDEMIETARQYLDCAGKDKEAASLFLARLLTRKDTCKVYLHEFIDWSREKLSNEPSIFETIGILGTFCLIFKIGQRETLLPLVDQMDEVMGFVESKDQFMSNSTVKKLLTKLSQRVGLCLLKPRVAAWRYQRGNRSLLSNLQLSEPQEHIQGDKISSTIAEATENDEDFEVPEAVEEVIGRLMNGLRDRDTIVRWSAAKGMGRMSSRLPKEMADDVVEGIFELFSEDVFKLPNGEPDISSASEHTWHGACLAIAELARRGLLLPQRLAELVPWIILALKFDIKRGAHSIGGNVRDAACYVCWSFARAYSPEVLEAHVRALSNTLIAVSVFDRDVNIRRASSAAFQENVGRLGIFPHGISIVTVADYFSLSLMTTSFLVVAPAIARYEEYKHSLADHLLKNAISHWDIAVREVAAESMAKIAILDIDYACRVTLPALTDMAISLDPATRHGGLIALGRTCKAIKKHSKQPLEEILSAETLKKIAETASSIPEFALSGFGSEHVRQALCVHMTCLAEASWPLEPSVVRGWKTLIDSTLERIEEPIQKLASETFRAVVAEYGISVEEFEHLLRRTSPGADRVGQRGFALALGEIDYKKPEYAAWVSRVIDTLKVCANHKTAIAADAADSEAKRNAIRATSNIMEVLGDDYRKVISASVSMTILQMFYTGLEDYNTDHRGDVGSWTREASMDGLRVMVPLVGRLDLHVPAEERYLTDEDHIHIMGQLMQQSVEKIDRVRACAAAAMKTILYAQDEPKMEGASNPEAGQEAENYILKLPHRNFIMKVIRNDEYLNWLQPGEVYPNVVNLLHLPEFRTELLAGLVISAG